jgi:hypothetical protein
MGGARPVHVIRSTGGALVRSRRIPLITASCRRFKMSASDLRGEAQNS